MLVEGDIIPVALFLLQYPIVPLFVPVIFPVQVKFPFEFVTVHPVELLPPASKTSPFESNCNPINPDVISVIVNVEASVSISY